MCVYKEELLLYINNKIYNKNIITLLLYQILIPTLNNKNKRLSLYTQCNIIILNKIKKFLVNAVFAVIYLPILNLT